MDVLLDTHIFLWWDVRSLSPCLQRIGQRPAYQRATAKAEPGMAPMLA